MEPDVFVCRFAGKPGPEIVSILCKEQVGNA
jgi:hypothetical protein